MNNTSERRQGNAEIVEQVRGLASQIQIQHEQIHGLDARMLLWARAQQSQADMLHKHMLEEEAALQKYDSLLTTISDERRYARELKQKLLQSTLSWGIVGLIGTIAALAWNGFMAKVGIILSALRG